MANRLMASIQSRRLAGWLAAGCLALAFNSTVEAQQFNFGRELGKLLTLPNSDCKRLKEWVGKAPMGAATNPRAGGPAMILISDEMFAPVFGKTYDALTMADFQNFQQSTRPACQKEGALAPLEWQLVLTIWNAQQQQRLAPQLAKRRADQQTFLASIDELERLGPTEEDFGRLKDIQQRGQAYVPNAAPDQKEIFQSRLLAAQQRVAEPVLSARIEATSSQPVGIAGYQAMARLRQEVDRPNLGLPAEHPARQQLNAAMGRLADGLAREIETSIRSLPPGLAGLEAGTRWLQDFDRQWSNTPGNLPPSVDGVRRKFLDNRQTALQAGRGELQAQLRRANNPNEPDAILSRYLLSSERSSPAGTELVVAAQQRVEAIERSSAIQRGGGGRDLPPAQADEEDDDTPRKKGGKKATLARGEPTEEVMYDLLKSRFDSEAQKMKEINDRCASGRVGNGNQMGNVMDAAMCLGMLPGKMMGTDQAIRIVSFRKLGCAKASGKPGYVCDYMVKTSHPMNQSMGSIIGSMMDSKGAGQGRFLDAGDSWIAYFGERN